MLNGTVALPEQFNVNSLYWFVGSVIGPDRQPRYRRVILDFSTLRFIEGDGLTVLGNTLEWLKRRGVTFSFINHQPLSAAVRYLDDCGFFETYTGAPLCQWASVRETTLPLTMVRHADSFSWMEHRFSPWLAPKLNTTPASLHNVRASLKEIFNNIQDHSHEETGCIHIQWYPNKDRIHVAISDFGRGIPAAISERYAVGDDGEAILLATQEGITTKSVQGNFGAGLSVLVHFVVLRNGGTVSIHSNYGVASFRPGKSGIRSSGWVGQGWYPGTLFNIRLRTDRMELAAPDREDLVW